MPILKISIVSMIGILIVGSIVIPEAAMADWTYTVCRWRGTSPFCDGKCEEQEEEVDMKCGNWAPSMKCLSGCKVHCCRTYQIPGQVSDYGDSYCRWEGTAPACDGHCKSYESEEWRATTGGDQNRPEFGSSCWYGTKAYCCGRKKLTSLPDPAVAPDPSNPIIAWIQWWHDKSFTGDRHRRDLHKSDIGKCLKLVHNDAMKSIKVHNDAGFGKAFRLQIFDNGNCSSSDDWGEITVDHSMSIVELPKIGRQGPGSVQPPGTYQFHRHDGLPGKVSAIRLLVQ